MRSRQILQLKRNQSPNPYPHKFHVSSSLKSYVEKYGLEGKIVPGIKLESVTGWLVVFINIRASGAKLEFSSWGRNRSSDYGY